MIKSLLVAFFTMGKQNTSRRGFAKKLAVNGIGLMAFSGVSAAAKASNQDWVGTTAAYHLESTNGDGGTQINEYDVTVVDKQGENLIIETSLRGSDTGTQPKYAIPVDSARQPVRGNIQRHGLGKNFVRNSSVNGMSTIRGTVLKGWFDSFHSKYTTDTGKTLELDVELLEREDVPNKTGQAIVLLPQIIPPDSHSNLYSSQATEVGTEQMDTETMTNDVTTQDITRFGYSSMTTKDNHIANLNTVKTNLQCWGHYDGNNYTYTGGDLTHSGTPNWWITGKDIYKDNNNYIMHAHFYGNFPAGYYTDWTDLHAHSHGFQNTGHNPYLYGKIKKRIPFGNWDVDQERSWYDGGKLYNFGARVSSTWYII